MLWSQRENSPPTAGRRRGLVVGEEAPNFAGVKPLVTKRWVNTIGPKDMIYLTSEGIAFCEAHRKEIESYVPYANLRSQGRVNRTRRQMSGGG